MAAVTSKIAKTAEIAAKLNGTITSPLLAPSTSIGAPLTSMSSESTHDPTKFVKGEPFLHEDFSGYGVGDPIDFENMTWGENVFTFKGEDGSMYLGSFREGTRTIQHTVTFPKDWDFEIASPSLSSLLRVNPTGIRFTSDRVDVFDLRISYPYGGMCVALPNTDIFRVVDPKVLSLEKRGNLFRLYADNKFIVSTVATLDAPITGFSLTAWLSSEQ